MPEQPHLPTAVVMNLSYTGLGIVRSLARRGIRVVGLTSRRRICGNYTRYADVRLCPDSQADPEGLLKYLVALATEFEGRSILFPTRDDDVVFLDRYREQLSQGYLPVVPPPHAVKAALDKLETYRWTQSAQVPSPRCWAVAGRSDVERLCPALNFPCVLKPLEAHHWRKAHIWRQLNHRKAIAVSTPEELMASYEEVAALEPRALLQELVPGGDQNLWLAACYLDKDGNLLAAYTAHKLLQVPDGFGTGCIVEAAQRPDLIQAAAVLLKTMKYSGLAEVEFKLDDTCHQYKVIEINPRPWDQHTIGAALGTDLIYAAYCDYAGIPFLPQNPPHASKLRWIADDVVLMTLSRMIWKRSPQLRDVLRMMSGHRIYGMWSARDPLPFLSYIAFSFVPQVVNGLCRSFPFRRGFRHNGVTQEGRI